MERKSKLFRMFESDSKLSPIKGDYISNWKLKIFANILRMSPVHHQQTREWLPASMCIYQLCLWEPCYCHWSYSHSSMFIFHVKQIDKCFHMFYLRALQCDRIRIHKNFMVSLVCLCVLTVAYFEPYIHNNDADLVRFI